MPKKVFILGATGMLGHRLCRQLPQHHFTVYAAVRDPATIAPGALGLQAHIVKIDDIFDDASLMELCDATQPDVIINCVGIIKQVAEAKNRYLSVAINSLLPHRLAHVAKEQNARLIHISTDCVFSGKKGEYTEADISDADDVYGKSKYLGETDDSEKNALTLRTSIIGHELKRPTNSFLEWALSQKNKTIKGYKQAFYTGFTTNEMANIMAMVINQHPQLHGLYHVASSCITKYELLHLINKIYQLNLSIEPDDDFYCDRSLTMDRFIQATQYHAPSWTSMIQTMYDQEKK